jgi:hypothetical protein
MDGALTYVYLCARREYWPSGVGSQARQHCATNQASPSVCTYGIETCIEMKWRDIHVKGYRKEELCRKHKKEETKYR